MSINLHDQLNTDCHKLGYINSSLVLLHKNSLVPWFILIPDTTENELFKLPDSQQIMINQQISELAQFVEKHFNADKLNIATIGNIVPQLHVHIIARFFDDCFWPAPVWGQSRSSEYSEQEIGLIKNALLKHNIMQV